MSTDPQKDTECPSVTIDILRETHEEVIARCDRMLRRVSELEQQVKQLQQERDDIGKNIEKRRKQQEKITTEFGGCTAM